MAQHDMVIDNGPGLAVRQDMNAAVQALVQNSSGPVAPTVTFPGMFWLDTSVAPNGLLRQRNLTNDGWISLTVSAGTPGEDLHALPEKTSLVDADEMATASSVSVPPWQMRKFTFATLKNAILGAFGLNIHGAPNKVTLVDADEFAIADSVSTPDAWSLKRHTWVQLRTMIGINPGQRLSYSQAAAYLADCNTAVQTGWYANNTTTTNTPIAAQFGVLQVIALGSNDLVQFWTQAGPIAAGLRSFERYKWAGTWGAWVETSSNNALLRTGANTIAAGAGYLQANYVTDAPTGGQYRPSPLGAGVGTAGTTPGNMRLVNHTGLGAWTFNAPDDGAGNGCCSVVVIVLNGAAPGAVTFAGFNKITGTFATAANAWTLCYITKFGSIKTLFLEPSA